MLRQPAIQHREQWTDQESKMAEKRVQERDTVFSRRRKTSYELSQEREKEKENEHQTK